MYKKNYRLKFIPNMIQGIKFDKFELQAKWWNGQMLKELSGNLCQMATG